MPKFSEIQLSDMTGKTRDTIRKRLEGIPHERGPKNAKLYDSKTALERIYGQSNEDGSEFITAAEAQRLLTIARRSEIDLNMEIARRERIPLAVIEATNDRVFSNVAGLLKAHVGKPLDEVLVADIFTELRSIGAVLTNGPS